MQTEKESNKTLSSVYPAAATSSQISRTECPKGNRNCSIKTFFNVRDCPSKIFERMTYDHFVLEHPEKG
eukprot:3357123-Ditylum_brightwellii.AAC.1